MSEKHDQLFSFLEKLLERQLLKQIDIAFSRWMMKQLPQSSDTQLFLATLVSTQLGEGHVCIELKDVPLIIEHWPKALRSYTQQYLPINISNEKAGQFDDLLDYKIIGDGQSITPLILDNNRLYLYRYWIYECQVATKLLTADPSLVILPERKLTEQLDKYFISSEQPDWQRIAAALTTRHKISVISGGPGTGKTTTVTKLLAIYIESQLHLKRRPIIQLAAPTGKAAVRLSESIALAKEQLQLPESVIELIPEQGKTLHRLLGSRFNSKKFIHNQDNPLLLDLLVVDEASMIDLPMMASVMNALSAQTRLILIGDKDQLASVEAGSVLGDICALPQLASYSQDQSAYLNATCNFDHCAISKYPFADQVAFLRKSYRFSAQSGIGALATASNQGDVKKIDKIFEQGFPDLNLIVPTQQASLLLEKILSGYQSYLNLIVEQNTSIQGLIEAFNKFQVLCALRVGDYGIEKVNLLIEQQLERLKVKELDNRWYVGRPVMVTRNDNQMHLYNGDIGIAAYDDVTGQLKVWFEQSGALRGVLPSRLPQHETVFAMTVHKSQGSEFSHVMLLLAQSTKVINRELVYTAITRAKHNFSYFGLVTILKQAVAQKTKRVSGLADRIWFTS